MILEKKLMPNCTGFYDNLTKFDRGTIFEKLVKVNSEFASQ